jgi:hypothetical protein
VGVDDRRGEFPAGGIPQPGVGNFGIFCVRVHAIGGFAEKGLVVGRSDHCETGRDRLGSENIVLTDDHVFEALLPPLFGDVFRYFMIVDRAGGMGHGCEIAMLLADFFGGDMFLELVLHNGLPLGVDGREAGDFRCARRARD